jgi:hypothetical protein
MGGMGGGMPGLFSSIYFIFYHLFLY